MNSNLSDLSQSNDEFMLFCWVLNQSNSPFSIKIGKDETVDDLRKAIKKKKAHALSGFDSDSLHLWKLSSPIPSSEFDKKLGYAQTPEEVEDGCVKLNPVNELSEYFLSPPRRHVHIVVQLPLYRSTDDTQIRHIRLLCEKYWNKDEEGRAEIYKILTVQVPFMSAEEAEEAEGMVTDVESPTTGAQEAMSVSSVDCAVSYESLSLGRDFSGFFGEGYSSILVRKEYRDMFQHISDLRKNRKRGVVVTGMPGIGKSIFLLFVLIERILNGQPTAYQCSSTRVILMLGRRDVRIFPENEYLDPQGYPGTWALADSNVPRGEFTDTRSAFYLVQAASPQPVMWKAWKKQLSASIAVMKPWSWEELYIGGTEFISPPLEALTLHDICVKYGGSARNCYTLAQSLDEVIVCESQIQRLLTGMPDISVIEGYFAGNTIDNMSESVIKASSQLITIIPNQNRYPRVTLVSRHIAEHFFKAVLVKNHERFWNYFNVFLSRSESRTPAGWLWEIYVIAVLFTRSTQTTPISLRPLSPIGSSQLPTKKVHPDPIELPFFNVIIHGDQKDLCESLSGVLPSLPPTKSILFKPGAKNQATFDALSISGNNIVMLYQATIWESHSINAKGLDFLWDALKLVQDQGTNTKQLLPPLAKWRVVFLIPEEAEKHWKTVQGIDFGGIKPKHQWVKYVEQFVGVLQKDKLTMTDLIHPHSVC